MKSNMIKRMLSAVIFAVLAMVSAAVLSYFGGNGNGVYAAANKLQLEGTPEIYVQSGTESIVNLKVKNVSGAEIKGVNLGCGYRSTDTDYEHWISHSSKFDSTDPLTGYTEHSDRFDGYFDREGYADPNAVWDENEEGYTIGAGKTADLWFKVYSMYEAPGTYDEWIRLGDIHTDWTGFLPVTILDEDYSEECPVKVVVYNPVNAAVTMGTSNNIARSIAKIDVGSAIDFGTLSLTGDTDLAARKTIYMRNTSTGYNGNIRKDEHGNSTDITLRACVSDPDDPYGITSNPFSASSTNLAPLPAAPMSADSYQYAMTDITLDAANYVEGTYTAVFRMSSIPHGVRVNGSSVHTNGIYTWPVKVTLRGTNPRIPKAPQNVTATPGNGQVELAWTAAAGEESYKTYHIYRRDGAEGNRDKANTAGFDWSQYEYIGSDTPDNEGQYFFVDGTAQNGKNYTYIITGDQPLQAYPAVSSTVKPLASIDRKLLAPEFCGGSEEAGGVKLEWQMNENYGGSDNDGSAMVDHFNIYRDG
ncbi:MAG: hypothetical protein IJJ07_02275, partial [Lachnospiraceae bacterium]|nr:hypothetical protein [Lachnospiraceae bacterium]